MRILRVDLGNKQIDEIRLNNEVVKKYVGRTGLGAKFFMKKCTRGRVVGP